ncbi:MAG: hypothetical protein KIY12_04500 [Thermoplasmata archaeon]|uniref:Uncharacterized protein n=1 Tax=Candidatus Sysuiplasma superficiale TaxID=2823368 RepID=A0A8J7YRW6_9ARCH|nr:hypothetical protein [Candidatus Sysuiplasma superficiale]MBX8643967.1 hypothetical protein [Candidatus Sysuiplasma superficiale]MCL4346894.1 hypothetical protein [Candidatus Thermoplasmatota archaeon]
MRITVVGGGCYGIRQTRSLLKAMDAGKIAGGTIVVVDRNVEPPAAAEFAGERRVKTIVSDWLSYLLRYFLDGEISAGDQLIPAHIAPHLLFDLTAEYLRKRDGIEVRQVSVESVFGLPFEKASGSVRYISAAAWLCPFSCIEPAICPAIRSERTWDLSKLVPEKMSDDADAVVVYKTEHYAWGVGSIPVSGILNSLSGLEELIEASGKNIIRIGVATTSNCHGVVGLMHVSHIRK